MISFKQYITELFEKPYRWQLKKDDEKRVMYQAVTDTGDRLRIDFEKWSGGIVNLSFSVDGSVGITGQGDAFKIMATVLDVIKDFIKNHEPKRIKFTADKEEGESEEWESREKLYSKMIERFAKKVGYKVKFNKNKFGTVFNLIKI